MLPPGNAPIMSKDFLWLQHYISKGIQKTKFNFKRFKHFNNNGCSTSPQPPSCVWKSSN